MAKEKQRIFEQTYANYLADIGQIDFLAKADLLGVVVVDGALVIPLFDQTYRLSGEGVVAEQGEELTTAGKVMLCKYVLTCQSDLPECEDRLVTYREFRDSGPLTSYFTTNTNKTIESSFSGNISALKKKGKEIGGKLRASDSYDVSLEFAAFPRIPIVLNFNDCDDLFPAVCSLLYRASAENFLDMECLAMTGTLLTGKLITS